MDRKYFITPNKDLTPDLLLILQAVFLTKHLGDNLGLSSSQISNSVKIPQRSIQRLLTKLTEAKFIKKQGSGRNITYTITRIGEGSIDPSTYLSLPTSKRTPIGYRKEYLENYIPNKTFFLNKKLRQELHLVGQTSGNTVMAETFSTKIYEHLLVDLSWASSNLEGNTYSLLETERLLKENLYP